jgi:hypothetical protein
MAAKQTEPIKTLGLAASGIWVRRQVSSPSLSDEALSLAQVLQIWNLKDLMSLDQYRGAHAEVSGPNLEPCWVYLIELQGHRIGNQGIFAQHPLATCANGQPVRLLALVEPGEFKVLGALVETKGGRRLLWLLEKPSRG